MLFRYPKHDLSSYKFPNFASFALPTGALIECWPIKTTNNNNTQANTDPVFSTFLLRVSDDVSIAEKVYGACITFYENFKQLNDEQAKLLNYNKDVEQLRTNKCIVLLSQHPFFDAFRNFLLFLYKLCNSNKTTNTPIEYYIKHFLNNIPFPSIQKPCVLVNLTKDDEISIYLPEEIILPQR